MAEELTQKLTPRINFLKSMQTKDLIQKIHRLEDELEQALREEASFKNLNAGYLGSYGSDCPEVERLLSELSLKAPEFVPGTAPEMAGTGKKMTAPDRAAWLNLQREQDKDVAAAINRQHSVAFQLENNRVSSEMAKKRLESTKIVLSLKITQIQFLTDSRTLTIE